MESESCFRVYKDYRWHPAFPWDPGTGVIENNFSTTRSTFARVWVNAHTDARTRFVIAD